LLTLHEAPPVVRIPPVSPGRILEATPAMRKLRSAIGEGSGGSHGANRSARLRRTGGVE
jgi:hypothetical protein